ncbi:hypothetical protein EVAR_67833_1 [Eumeta japonica]|uniref:Uncharacterized protein n=1 Tax=Eumeta variegata TaxID=151549 RepID=A0A4C1T965_EUMVA|nr:hypothetical protein EVAR_67833_1 [Eumeta japonica]
MSPFWFISGLADALHVQYKIPKKEEVVEQTAAEPDNPLMRKKKTPEELAAEAELEDQDEFTSQYRSALSFPLSPVC